MTNWEAIQNLPSAWRRMRLVETLNFAGNVIVAGSVVYFVAHFAANITYIGPSAWFASRTADNAADRLADAWFWLRPREDPTLENFIRDIDEVLLGLSVYARGGDFQSCRRHRIFADSGAQGSLLLDYQDWLRFRATYWQIVHDSTRRRLRPLREEEGSDPYGDLVAASFDDKLTLDIGPEHGRAPGTSVSPDKLAQIGVDYDSGVDDGDNKKLKAATQEIEKLVFDMSTEDQLIGLCKHKTIAPGDIYDPFGPGFIGGAATQFTALAFLANDSSSSPTIAPQEKITPQIIERLKSDVLEERAGALYALNPVAFHQASRRPVTRSMTADAAKYDDDDEESARCSAAA